LYLFIAIFIYRGLIGAEGEILNRDLVKPPSLEGFFHFYYPLWSEYESVSTISRLPQLMLFLPFFGIGFLFDMDSSEMLTTMYISFHFLAGAGAYYTTRYLLKRTYRKERLKIMGASFVAGLAYMWSSYIIYRSFHPSILAVYGLAPLLVLSLIVCFEKKKIRYALLTALLWSLACADVHWIVFGALLILGYFSFNAAADIIGSLRARRSGCHGSGSPTPDRSQKGNSHSSPGADDEQEQRSASIRDRLKCIMTSSAAGVKLIFAIMASYICFSLYWLLPGFFMGGTSRYGVVITLERIDTAYSHAPGILDVIIQQGGYHGAGGLFATESSILGTQLMGNLMLLSGLVVFVLGLLALYFKPRNRHVAFFSAFALILVFLVSCVSLAPGFGHWLIFDAPLHQLYGWAFKSPKMYQLALLSLCILSGFSLVEIFTRIERTRRLGPNLKRSISAFVIIVLIFSILLPGWPLATGDMNDNLRPVDIPDEYRQANIWLDEQTGDFKVLWLPSHRQTYMEWNNGTEMHHDIAAFSSSRPTYISTTPQWQPNGYGIYVVNSALDWKYGQSILFKNGTGNLGGILTPLGIKYILYHEDVYSPPVKDGFLDRLKNQDDLELVERFGFIYIFENECLKERKDTFFSTSSQGTLVTGGVASLSTINSLPDYEPVDNALFFSDQKSLEFKYLQNAIDKIIFTESTGMEEMVFTFADQRYFIAPYDHTDHYKPSEMWSKNRMVFLCWDGRAQRKGDVDASWDWGYDRGVVYTWSAGKLIREPSDSEKIPVFHYGFEKGFEGFGSATAIVNVSRSNRSMSGEYSLMGAMEKGESRENQIAGTGMIEIPEGNEHFNISMHIAASNANNVQVLLRYYDEDSEYIEKDFLLTKSWDFDFIEIGENLILPPVARYLTIQVLADQNPIAESYWWVDDIRMSMIEEKIIDPNMMSMDFEVDEGDEYEIFIRALKGEKCGAIDIHLDDMPLRTLDTLGKPSSFQWNSVGTRSLKEGVHTVAIENVAGFNAVNLIAVIPESKAREYRSMADELIRDKDLIYALEAESTFNRLHATTSGSHGNEASMGRVLRFNDYGTAWNSLEILRSGTYSLSIGCIGAVEDEELTISIGNRSFRSGDVSNSDNSWINLTGIHLERGNHLIRMTSPEDTRYVAHFSFEDGWNSTDNAPYHWTSMENNTVVETTHRMVNILNRSFENGWNSSGNAPYLWHPPRNATLVNISTHTEYFRNHSFEDGWNVTMGAPYGWFPPEAQFDASLVPGTRTHEEHSLKLTTDSAQPKTWSKMNSEDIYLAPNRTYDARIDMKIENCNQSHVKIMGYDDTSAEWAPLSYLVTKGEGTGTENWKKYSNSFHVPGNISRIMVSLNAGAALDHVSGNATTWFDNFSISREIEDITTENVNFTASLDPEAGTDGNYSLRLTTENAIPDVWSWMNSESIILEPDEKYVVSMDVKTENCNGSHVKLRGNNRTSGKWENIAYLLTKGEGTGTAEWTEHALAFTLPENISEVMVTLNIGGVLDPGSGNSALWCDDLRFFRDEGLSSKNRTIFSVSLDRTTRTDGEFSLRLTTDSGELETGSEMKSEPVRVEPGKTYTASMDVRTRNLDDSRVNIKGYNSSTGRWDLLKRLVADIKGDNGWTEFEESFIVPHGMNEVRLFLNINGVLDPRMGNATAWFDDLRMHEVMEKRRTDIDLVVLHSGDNNRTLKDLFRKDAKATVLDYERVSATRYRVRVSSSGPFILGFTEAYDEFWVASVGGLGRIRSVPLNGMINGFYINRTGNFTIIIEFMPQKWFEIGMWITALSMTGSLGFFIWVDRKRWGKRLSLMAGRMAGLGGGRGRKRR